MLKVFLKRMGLFALIMLPLSSFATTTLKIATIAPDGTSWMHSMREGAEEISTRTQGRVKLKFYPGGAMGNDKSVLRKIRIGQLQGGAITSGAMSSVFSDAQIYSLPFQFDSLEQVQHVRAQMDTMLLQDIETNGFVVLGMSSGGFAYLFAKQPVRRLADLQGQRVWIPEDDRVGRAVFEAVGVTPVALPLSDVLTALQTGLLDVVIANPTGAIAFQWHTKLNYMMDTPLVFLIGMLVVDKKSFYAITEQDRVIVKEVMKARFNALDKTHETDNIQALEVLRQQGIEFLQPSDSDRQMWQDKASQALQKLPAEDVYSAAYFDRLQQLLRDDRADMKRASLSAE